MHTKVECLIIPHYLKQGIVCDWLMLHSKLNHTCQTSPALYKVTVLCCESGHVCAGIQRTKGS